MVTTSGKSEDITKSKELREPAQERIDSGQCFLSNESKKEEKGIKV